MLATESPSTTRRLGGSVLLVVVVLALAVPFLGRDALFSADEGAAVAQARLLQEGRGWALDHPLPSVDPEGRAFPLDNSSPVARPEGRPAAAPFAKHPVYAALLVPFDRVAGVLGMTLTSVLGTVVAALVAGLLTRRLEPAAAPAAVVITGLATPLLFDAWLVIAHSLGAALAGVAVLGVLRADEGRGGRAVLATGAAVAGAVLLRNEAVLFGVALGLTAVGVGLARRRRPLVLAGGAALGGAVVAHLVDGVLARSVTGDAVGPFQAGVAHAGFLAGRVQGAVVTLLLPSYGAVGPADLLLFLTAIALVAAVVVARRRPDDGDLVRVLVVTAAVAAVGRAVVAPEVVPGLLLAAPLVTAGLAALRPGLLRGTAAQVLAGTSALFVGAVLATQYATGGSGEWGGRYFALVLPVAVPLVVVAGRDLLARLTPEVARTALVALAVVALAGGVSAGRALRSIEDRSTALVATVDAGRARLADPVVVATAGAAPRFAWPDVLAGSDWLLVEVDEVDDWLRRLREEGRDVVLATPEPAAVTPEGTGYEVVGEDEVGHGSAWVAVALRPA